MLSDTMHVDPQYYLSSILTKMILIRTDFRSNFQFTKKVDNREMDLISQDINWQIQKVRHSTGQLAFYLPIVDAMKKVGLFQIKMHLNATATKHKAQLMIDYWFKLMSYIGWCYFRIFLLSLSRIIVLLVQKELYLFKGEM